MGRLEYRCELSIKNPLIRLQSLPYADAIKLFGSVARGKANPADIDAMMTFADMSSFWGHPARWELLKIAQRYYGCFDPFIRVGRRLLTRSDYANEWILSKNSRAIYRNYLADCIPLQSLNLFPLAEEGVL